MTTVQNWTRLIAGLLVGVGMLLAAGCDSTGSSSGSAQGAFTLRLTDAPADLDSAVVTVDRVELVGEDTDDNDDGEDDGTDDDESDDDAADGDDEREEGIITLTDSTRQIDLLRYQDGNTALLADDVTVPAGEYSQLRFVLGNENYVVLDDGSRPSLSVGSQEIKIILPEVEVENDGDRLEVTLDFDVEDSFIEQGNGDYRLKPTIKVKNVFVNGNAIETVSVEGPVTAVEAGAGTVAVDSINFATTPNTEFDDGTSLSTLSVGQYVGVEGTIASDGSVLEAREIEVEDDEERSITARIEALGDRSLTVLGTTIEVTDNTEFDDDGGFGGLQTGTRVEVDYTVQDGIRVAIEIEEEDD